MLDHHAYTEAQGRRERDADYSERRGRFEPVVSTKEETMSEARFTVEEIGRNDWAITCNDRKKVCRFGTGRETAERIASEMNSGSVDPDDYEWSMREDLLAQDDLDLIAELLAALKGLEDPKEPGRFCDHADYPSDQCPLCRAAQEAIAKAEGTAP